MMRGTLLPCGMYMTSPIRRLLGPTPMWSRSGREYFEEISKDFFEPRVNVKKHLDTVAGRTE